MKTQKKNAPKTTARPFVHYGHLGTPVALKLSDEQGREVLTFIHSENTSDAAKYAENIARFIGGKACVHCIAVPDFWVFSTAIASRSILLKDKYTGAFSRVDDPTEEEWSEAFHAPSAPYRWPVEKNDRVICMNFLDGEYVRDIQL